MDRSTVNIAKSQVGFIDVIVSPAYELLFQVIPQIEGHVNNIQENKARWTDLIDEYEDRMYTERRRIEVSLINKSSNISEDDSIIIRKEVLETLKD